MFYLCEESFNTIKYSLKDTSFAATMKLQVENTERLKNVLKSFSQKDLRLVCRDNQVTYTSTLLLAISSGFLKGILREIFEHRSRLDDEPVTMYLPDFNVYSVEGVLQV